MIRILILALLVSVTGCTGSSEQQQVADPAIRETPEPPKEQSMPTYPTTDDWEHANQRQKDRAKRSFAELKIRHVPVYTGPLFVDDDESATVQIPQDVARRAIILWAVAIRGEGAPQEEVKGIIDKLDLWPYVSPNEKRFLEDKDPSPETSQKLVWRLESLYVLLWSLGYIDDLNWPADMCDVGKLVEAIKDHEADPAFIKNAKLRPVSELLDAQDLTMRIHWAIRDAMLNHGGKIPSGLDWSGELDLIPLAMSPAVGVVEQRHYVLNWILKFMNPKSWDDVDTPT